MSKAKAPLKVVFPTTVPTKNLPIAFEDNIIISKLAPEQKSTGGIIIPEVAIKHNNSGYVVAVGPLVGKLKAARTTVEDYPCVKVGDSVIYSEHGGIPFEYLGQEYLVMKESQVHCAVPRF